MKPSTSSKVVTYRHKPNTRNLDELIAPVVERAAAYLQSQHFHFVYLNPASTVLGQIENHQFFDEARKRRTEWCVQVKRTLGRNFAKAIKTQIQVEHAVDKNTAYHLASAAFSGIMIVNGELIHSDRWASHSHHPEKGSARATRGKHLPP